MLIGYVSDHRYVALPGVEVELIGPDGSIAATSRATGSVHADLPPGRYEIVLAKDGYGAKRVTLDLPTPQPHQFRLLKDDLLGYVWPKWVRGGDASEFRVHSDAAYKLELFRYGLAKEFIRTIGWYDEHGPRATVQITPDGDYSQTGVAWNKFGYTSPHHKQFVTAPQRSGLYYFHARSEAGRFFSFPWIVAPARPQSPVAVLASNITWNAYNSFGGRSNYIHPDRLPPTPTVNARLELNRYTNPEHVNYAGPDYAPLSFDRPEPICSIPEHVQASDPIEGRAACHVAEAEWRLLAWMEREGFAYDFYAETQLHFGQLDLDAYKVLVISTHPEYWSHQMVRRVKDWVFHHGGRLMYLGGNGLNCDVEFLDEATCIYRNDDERRLRAVGNALRGVPESRFNLRHESEASLLGVVYDDRGIMTAAPFRVIDSRHWIFAGSGLREGDLFGQKSLHMRVPGGASGHETDKISPSSPTNTRLLARGENPGGGGAEMVIHEPAGGGAVFSAGSISWPASVLVDDAVSTITANVLRRFLDERMKIAAIETHPARIPLKAAYRMISALGKHWESHFVLVRLLTDDGLEGAGEASATVRWSGETVWSVQTLIDRVLAPLLIGQELNVAAPIDSIAAIDRLMDQAAAHNWFAKSAVEMACWDVLGKAAGKPVYELLGGACRPLAIRSRFSMGAYDVARARARAAELVEQGFDTVKVKVGGQAEDDIARVRAVRDVIGPDRALVIDANCGWDADTAIHCLRELNSCNIAVMEQPTPDGDYAAIARVRRESGVKVMADDMCFNLVHAQELIRNQACDIISVYPGKNGGILKSRQIVELAERHGIACTIGSNLEWDVATAAMGHLIVATPNLRVEDYPGDIHGPAYYERRIAKEPLSIVGPVTTLTSRPGLGVEVDWPLVRELCVAE